MSSFELASQHLSAADSDIAALITRIGPCMLKIETLREPYEALIRAIAHQQIHGRAAETILGRFLNLFPEVPFPHPQQILETEASILRGCGFSASKIAAIHDIADKTLQGRVPTRQATETLSDEELIARLVTLRGVGRWTVEMLLIFSLGRPDVFPVDDFGVREGWRIIKSLPEQPKPKAFAESSKILSPYRSVASWYLWQAANQARDAKKKKS